MTGTTTTPAADAARLCGELVTLLTCARQYAASPDDFAKFHADNLLNCAADLADRLHDRLLQDESRARKVQPQSAGDAA